MKNLVKIFFIVLMVFAAAQAHAKGKNIKAMGGVNIPVLGIAIDGSYDPRLDTLVPGYKVVNVVLINGSFTIFYLDAEKDKWNVRLAGDQSDIKAIANLRKGDGKAWGELPQKVRDIIAYPLVLPIGGREVLDLFVPDTVDLSKLNEISVYFKSIDSTINVTISGG